MGLTHFPNGITSFGIPVFGGMFPTQGVYYFVKPSSGSDGNTGLSPDKALKTLAAAHTKATANQNDVIVLFAESNTAASTTDYQSATLTWSKNLTHLIGVCAPTAVSQRARIAQLSTATAVSPLMNVTANGCYFANFQLFHGVADATSIVCLQVTGDRNVFESVHIAGMGDTSKTQSVTGAASLKLDGGDENVFRRCTLGLDTATRDADTNGELWLDTAASRNFFEDCLFEAFVDAAGYHFVTVNDATGLDRWLWFKNCLFTSKSANKTIDITSVFSIPAISQGAIILQNSYFMSDGGTTAVWDSGSRGIIWNNSVAAAASGAGGEMTNL